MPEPVFHALMEHPNYSLDLKRLHQIGEIGSYHLIQTKDKIRKNRARIAFGMPKLRGFTDCHMPGSSFARFLNSPTLRGLMTADFARNWICAIARLVEFAQFKMCDVRGIKCAFGHSYKRAIAQSRKSHSAQSPRSSNRAKSVNSNRAKSAVQSQVFQKITAFRRSRGRRRRSYVAIRRSCAGEPRHRLPSSLGIALSYSDVARQGPLTCAGEPSERSEYCNTPGSCEHNWKAEWRGGFAHLIHHPDIPLGEIPSKLMEVIDGVCKDCLHLTIDSVLAEGKLSREVQDIEESILELMKLQTDEPVRANLRDSQCHHLAPFPLPKNPRYVRRPILYLLGQN
ncbi:hypothetical protein B0H11DRAFT_1938679 [Mycena galericulata]|nr:hypothetical protein B0H11DRAFT_1938679 [Mycena galericulata]